MALPFGHAPTRPNLSSFRSRCRISGCPFVEEVAGRPSGHGTHQSAIHQKEHTMAQSVLFMSVSLDGYISTPDDYLGGDDGERLHRWFERIDAAGEQADDVRALVDEIGSAGAVLTGRRTAELMDHWGGDLHGAPIFVPSHRPPGPAARYGYPKVTYVTD